LATISISLAHFEFLSISATSTYPIFCPDDEDPNPNAENAVDGGEFDIARLNINAQKNMVDIFIFAPE